MNIHSCPALRWPTIAFLTASAAFSLPTMSRAETYLGGSVGSASIETTINGIGFDEDDSTTKLIIGYIFDLPVFDLSLEANYVDFGAPRNDPSGAEMEITGIDAFVVAGLDFGLVGAFAKAGAIAWDADASAGSFASSSDGTDSVYGIGLRFNVASLFLRVEYEKFDIEATDDVDMISAGLVWRF